MKKLLLGLGAIAAVTAPIVAVVACSDNGDHHSPKEKEKAQDVKNAQTVKLADATGFVLADNDGLNLYIPNGDEGTKVSFSDTSVTPARKVVIEVTTAATKDTLPVVTKTVDGVEDTTFDQSTISKASKEGIVLLGDGISYYTTLTDDAVQVNPFLISFAKDKLVFTGTLTENVQKLKDLFKDLLPEGKEISNVQFEDTTSIVSSNKKSRTLNPRRKAIVGESQKTVSETSLRSFTITSEIASSGKKGRTLSPRKNGSFETQKTVA